MFQIKRTSHSEKKEPVLHRTLSKNKEWCKSQSQRERKIPRRPQDEAIVSQRGPRPMADHAGSL